MCQLPCPLPSVYPVRVIGPVGSISDHKNFTQKSPSAPPSKRAARPSASQLKAGLFFSLPSGCRVFLFSHTHTRAHTHTFSITRCCVRLHYDVPHNPRLCSNAGHPSRPARVRRGGLVSRLGLKTFFLCHLTMKLGCDFWHSKATTARAQTCQKAMAGNAQEPLFLTR